jgi:hypothetical protein
MTLTGLASRIDLTLANLSISRRTGPGRFASPRWTPSAVI